MVGEDFGASGVPLEKSVIPDRQREFFPTEAEFKGRREQQIVIAVASFDNVTTGKEVFKVAPNDIAFITSAWIGIHPGSSGLADNTNFVSMRIIPPDGSETGENNILSCGATNNANAGDVKHGQVSISFPMPIKLEAGFSIKVFFRSALNDYLLRTGITGWSEKKEITPGGVIP